LPLVIPSSIANATSALAAGPERPLVVLTSSRSAADLGGVAGWDGAAGFIAKSDLTVAAVAALVGDAA